MKDRLPADPHALFAYGTLQFPEVLEPLLGRIPPSSPASTRGWRVAALPGRNYPGLVRHSGAADGRLITGLTATEWRILDGWEDDFYELHELALTDGRTGWSWVCPPGYAVEPYDWVAAEFATTHLPAFSSALRP